MIAAEAAEIRRQRGLAIAATTKIVPKNGYYLVPSQSGAGSYRVHPKPPNPFIPRCTCPDYEERGEPCKHVYAVEYALKRERNRDGSTRPPRRSAFARTTVAKRPTYKQDWRAYNAAQINEKAKFLELLADLCRGVAEPERNAGSGPQAAAVADHVFACVFKVYSTLSVTAVHDRPRRRPRQGVHRQGAALQRDHQGPGTAGR